jgi:hypothetical protein
MRVFLSQGVHIEGVHIEGVHIEIQENWQPAIQSVVDAGKILLEVINRYEQIYRQASVGLLTFSEET